MRIFFAFCSVLIGVSAVVAGADVSVQDREIGAIIESQLYSHGSEDGTVSTLNARMRHYHVPGLALALVDGGVLRWSGVYGDTSAGVPVTPETLFQVASLTKPVTGMLAIRLAAQGVIDLKADIRRYLQNWSLPAGPYSAQNPVTVEHVLAHTGGFNVHGFAGYPPGTPLPTLLNILDGTPPANSDAIRVIHEPATQWVYSGGGYVVLQQALEDVTGQPFGALIENQILAPLGMTHSRIDQPLRAADAEKAAQAHDRDGNRVASHIYPGLAPSGLWSTAGDMAALMIDLMKAYQGERAVFSQQEAQRIASEVFDGMGPGFAVDQSNGHLRLTHGGDNKGFKAFIAVYPERRQGLVMMANGDQGGPLLSEIYMTLSRHFGW